MKADSFAEGRALLSHFFQRPPGCSFSRQMTGSNVGHFRRGSRFWSNAMRSTGYHLLATKHHKLLSVRKNNSPSEAAREAFVGSFTELVANTSNFGAARST